MAYYYDIKINQTTSTAYNYSYAFKTGFTNSVFDFSKENVQSPQNLNMVEIPLPPPQGSNDPRTLSKAPSPKVTILGEEKIATIVVDIQNNILYHYDENGKPDMAYLVATGKKGTPTDPAINIVSHIEEYPYRTASIKTKRRNNPKAYGPNAIIPQKIDPKTGVKTWNGELIHGNNDPASIGKHSSTGCIRMDNDVIQILSKQIKRGDIIIYK